METTLKKSGNSYSITIPKSILQLLHLDNKSVFVMTTDGERLIIESKKEKPSARITNAVEKIDKQYSAVFTSLANK